MNYLTGSIMSDNLISISEERDIQTADELMKLNKIRHLPVVNLNNELSGILSAKDVAKAKDKKNLIRSIMTTPVKVVKKTDNVKTVIELMLQHKICSVLVAGDDDIVGIITTDDLLKLLADVIEEHESIETTEISSFYDESWVSPS